MENETTQTSSSIQSSHSESGNGQSNEGLCNTKFKAQLGHEGTNAVSEDVNGAASLHQSSEFVSAQIANCYNSNGCQNAFQEHGAVTNQLCTLFVIQLLGGGTGGNQGMEAGDSTAGNGYEQHGEHGVIALRRRIKGGNSRQLNAGLINGDACQSKSDASIQQEGVQIVTRLQQNPNRSDGSDEDISHEDVDPGSLGQNQREHVTSSDSSYQQYNANTSTNLQVHATAIYAQAKNDSQYDKQQGCSCRSRASNEGTSNDVCESCNYYNQGYISKNGE